MNNYRKKITTKKFMVMMVYEKEKKIYTNFICKFVRKKKNHRQTYGVNLKSE